MLLFSHRKFLDGVKTNLSKIAVAKVSYDDDDEIRLWILNDEGLYNMARGAGLTEDTIGDSSSDEYNNFVEENRTEIVDTINRSLGHTSSKNVSIAQLKTLATAQGFDHIVAFLDKASLKEQVEVKAYLKQAAPKAKKDIPSKLPYAQVGERDVHGMTEVSIYVNDARVKSIKTDDVDSLVRSYKNTYPLAEIDYRSGILTITPKDSKQESEILYSEDRIIKEMRASKKNAALIFGEDRKAIAEDKGNAFGLEGKDRIIASEDQKKIYTPKKVEPTTGDEQRYSFRDRQKIETWNPTTSDIKAAVGAVAEALKAKPDFPEILNRAEKDPVAKRDEKSAKEKSASLKVSDTQHTDLDGYLRKIFPDFKIGEVSSLIDYNVYAAMSLCVNLLIDVDAHSAAHDVHNTLVPHFTDKTLASKKTASLGEQLDGAKLVKYDPSSQLTFAWFGGTGVNIYDETGYEVDYFQVDARGDKASPEEIEKAIMGHIAELGKENTASKKTAALPWHSEDTLLAGITFQDLIDVVIANEPTRDPEAIERVFRDIIQYNTKDANAELNTHLKDVLAEIAAYEKAGSKKKGILATEWLRQQREKEQREEDAKKKQIKESVKTADKDSYKARYMQQNAQFSAGGSTHLEAELKKYFEGTPITVTWKASNLLELNLNGVKEEDFAKNAGGKGIEGFNGLVMQFNGDYDYPENGKVKVYPNWRRSMGRKTESAVEPAAAPSTIATPATGVAPEGGTPQNIEAAKKTAETIEFTLGQPMTIKDPSGTDKRVIPTEVDPNTKKITMVPEGTETTTVQQQ